MTHQHLLSLFDCFFRLRGLDPMHNVISKHETIVCNDDSSIAFHVDAQVPSFCRVDRVFYDTGVPEDLLRDIAIRITQRGRCVKAWACSDTLVLCFESFDYLDPMPAGVEQLDDLIRLLDRTWAVAKNVLASREVRVAGGALQFIDRFENELRDGFPH